MTENEKDTLPEDYGKIKSPFLSKVENFFYHYKWHTIAAVFIIFTISFCIFQACNRKKYDIHVLYAGGTSIPMASSEGEAEPLHTTINNAIKRFTKDYDKDGTKSIVFTTLYIPSAEQIKEIESMPGDYTVNYALVQENKEAFNQHMLYGDYNIVIMSKSLCEELISRGDNNPLAKISTFLPEDYSAMKYELVGDFGVLLSSTPLADNPGFSELDEDTVIAIKRYAEIGRNTNKETYYKRSEEVFRLMLSDEAAN